MKKNTLFSGVLLTAAMFSLVSCNKEEEKPSNATTFADPLAVVSSVEISKIIDDEDGEEQNFSYDSEGRLSEVSYGEFYEDEWGTYESSTTMELIYTNNKLTQVKDTYTYTDKSHDGSTYQGNSLSTTTYSYNGKNQIEKAVNSYREEWGGQVYSDTEEMVFTYDSENRLIKLAEFDEGQQEDYLVFNWSGNNVSKEQYFYVDNSGSRIKTNESPLKKRRQELHKKTAPGRMFRKADVLEAEYVYSAYDDKKNPLAILALLYGYADGHWISANNPGKISTYYPSEKDGLIQEYDVTFKYAYDEKGRPVKVTMTFTYEDESEPETESVTIVYKN